MLQRLVAGAVARCGAGRSGLRPCAWRRARFPSKNITMVVPLPAGGTADLLCRYAAEKATALLGQQVVVENRPGGAGGRVGMEQVLRSPPDGYTLLCSTQLSYSITHLVFTKASFDPRPLEPVSVLATYPLIIIVAEGFPGEQSQGIPRLRQGQRRQGHLRPSGQGQHRPSARRTDDAEGQLQDDRGAVSRQRAGDQRSARRHHRHGPGLSARQQRQHRRRQAEADRGRRSPAAEGISERPDHGGDHARRHLDHLDGGVGAARHAEGDHQEDFRRDRRRASSSPTCRSASSSSKPIRSAPRRSGCAR